MNDDQQPQSLREVARAALDAHPGISGRELERVARRQGLTISYTTINHLAAGTYKSRPSRKTLDALAALSKLPHEAVYAAAHEPLPRARFAEQLPPDADTLDGAQREAVLSVVRQLAAANRALHEAREDVMGNAEHPAPTSISSVDSTVGSGGFLARAYAEVADIQDTAQALGGLTLAELLLLLEADDPTAAAEVVAAGRDLDVLYREDLQIFFRHDHIEEALDALRERKSARDDPWAGKQAARTVPAGSTGQRRRRAQDAAGEESQDPADHRAALSKSVRKRARDQARDDASTP
ncbi:MAG: hypothetical protein VX494_04095 [Actinomycetota bacterium]|nr:hypothetical protein [Actinomycetota bacterium]